MTLNQGQQAAADGIFQFLLSDEKEYSVSGPGGSGKTYLLDHVMQELLPLYEKSMLLLNLKPIPFTIQLTATTNKAAEVLSDATGKPTSTIHSFMNLRVKDNFKTGVSEVSRSNKWVVHTNTILIIDEASMIDTPLLRFIREGTDSSCKVIFVGDHCQLAPVFEPISPIYVQRTANFSELSQSMRNAGQPALMALCQQLRDTVETNVFKPIQEVPGVIDFLDDEAAQDYIDATFAQEQTKSRILAYTNQKVQEYNAYIRELRGYPEHFTTGERLINNAGIQVGNRMLRVEEEFIIGKVDAENTVTISLPLDGELKVYNVTLLSPMNPMGVGLPAQVPTDPEHFKELVRFYANRKEWTTYYQLKNTYPDLRQKDAATAYKAQGSTYDEVFIDLANIGKCTQSDQVARMLYVAVSRPKNRILFHGRLPPRYCGGA